MTKKTDNRPAATTAKLQLRNYALKAISPANVLEVYCGIDGVMFEGCWREAQSCAGIDQRYQLSDARDRYVGDSIRVLRCLDLSRFNVFDVDAYGDPWPALILIAKRRRWAAGERGAICITDGSSMNARFGQASASITELTGLREFPTGVESAERVRQMCRSAWRKLAGVSVVQCYEAVSERGKTGNLRMVYSTLIVEGVARTTKPTPTRTRALQA